MKSYDRNFYDLLTQVGQTYVIPSFQRDYSWDLPQWEALWDDIQYLINSPAKYHYTGSLVYIPSQEHSTYLREVIDGQQRLTTISLIYLAAYTLLEEGTLDNYNPKSLWVQVLANEHGVETERLKLKPSGADGEIYKKLFEGKLDDLTSVQKKSNIYRGFQYFRDKLTGSKTEVEDLITAARRLQVIEIVLNNDDDHPQKVFESINSTGKKLTVDDLIRNYVLMRGDYNEREKIFNQHWSKIESRLKKDNESLLEEFFTTFIKLRLQKDVTKSDLYASFKRIYDKESDTTQFLDELLIYAGIYEYIKYNRGVFADKLASLRYYFDVLNFLKIDVLNTFTLPAIKDFINRKISKSDLDQIFEFIINYLSRRLLAGKNTTSLNKYAPGLYSKLNKYKIDTIADVLIHEFTTNVPAQIAYPSDKEVEQGILTQDFYSRKDTCRYALLALDNANRDNQYKQLLKDGSLTIEHVMPQTLPRAWKDQLGPNYLEVHERFLNNLANLTLTAYNGSYSNRPFAEKLKTPEGTGLAESPLLINQFFKTTTAWNEEAISNRQNLLVQNLLRIFPTKRAKNDYHSKLDKEFIQVDGLGNIKGKTPDAFMLYDSTYPVQSWKDLYIEFVDAMTDQHGASQVLGAILAIPTNSQLITKDETELRNPGRLKSGYFLECNKSAMEIVATILRFIEAFNDIDFKDLRLKLKSGS